MKKAFVLITVIVSWALAATAANTVPPDTLAARMWRQVLAFPQEKLYAQTDRYEYTCGDTIWVRHHIANATTGLPSYASRYVYVELVDPMGHLVRRVMMRQDEHGAIYGYVPTYTDMPSGLYMLRAYTRYMADTTPEYLYQCPLRLHSALENSVRITPEFHGRTLRLSFADPYTGNAGISGLQYNSAHEWFKYRGKEVYLFVDGSMIGTNYDSGGTNIDTWSMIQAFMQSLRAKDVYQVDVVKGPSVNGLPGVNGVGSVGFDMCAILITTNREYEPMHMKNVSLVRPLGYQKPSAVYNPRFEPSDKGRWQNTIYWNPSVRVKNGRASLTFFNGGTARLRFRIEGIASDGKIVNASIFKERDIICH